MRLASLIRPALVASAAIGLAAACAHDPAGTQRPSNEEIDAAMGTPATVPGEAPDTLPTTDPTLAAEFARAKEALEDAEFRMSEADASYSRMKRARKPRGAAKEEIVQERMAAHVAYNEAKANYDALKRRTGLR